ncbi:sugar kinase [Bifidobacterium actinocoloniiforme DSM 22766]|uniref:Multifunctional fusion protein n=1 Tax=Bifidobacterium actinocoloniiforme DSM 22766 TaxID=1437605 RepID=A0A086Z0J7_9BIFI|nr:bifunctional ADP-dependent NAD(P)H-hydrate dehydratase/NAD(P)H-hydrate epimerase [Bifidobacterium actinocoloniiforme]KFI40047.1 sugar kinase [Bifidobacterium actinocoloniiforme DSM 22766]
MSNEESWVLDKLTTTAYQSSTVRSLERPLLDDGVPLMRMAAKAVALNARLLLAMSGMELDQARVVLLAGGGDNGGDGLYAGALLASAGSDVTAVATSNDLHDQGLTAFLQAGGVVLALSQDSDIPGSDAPASADEAAERLEQAVSLARSADLVIDAMTGIGLNGALHGVADALACELGQADGGLAPDVGIPQDGKSKRPLVLAVDLPSGIGVDDGSLPGSYIPADVTVTFGALKPCCLLPPAAYTCGRTVLVDFGFDLDSIRPDVEAMTAQGAADVIRAPRIDDSKYTRGVVGLVTGSERYPGAAILSTRAAAAAGAGMVRYMGPSRPTDAVLAALPEAVSGPGRVQSLVLGSGVPTEQAANDEEPQRETIGGILRTRFAARPSDEDSEGDTEIPAVADAGALDLLPGGKTPPTLVLTPHFGELAKLLNSCGESLSASDIAAEPLNWAIKAWELTGATVLLKGAVSIIVGEDQEGRMRVMTTGFGPVWLSTAGSGDVLAGVLGATLAGAADRLEEEPWQTVPIAASGAFLHGLAGSLASGGLQRGWRQPLVYDPENPSDFLERAQDGWKAESKGAGPWSPLGHPIHATDIVSHLEEAQGLLLALPYTSQGEDDADDDADAPDGIPADGPADWALLQAGWAGPAEFGQAASAGIDSLWF